MFRSAILIVFIVPFVSAQSDPCVELLEKLTTCTSSNNGVTGVQPSDGTSCLTCFTNSNFFDLYDQTTATCDEANSEVCEFLNICNDDCFLTLDVCQEEYDDYFACSFGSSYAPTGCVVQCDSIGSTGNETDSGETDGDETDGDETDGGETDGGEIDGGETDGGETDGGETDGGEADGGKTDGGETDGGETDGGETDGGEADGDETDGGETDGGAANRVNGTTAGSTNGNGNSGSTVYTLSLETSSTLFVAMVVGYLL